MSDKVDGRCSNCGERKLVMEGEPADFFVLCQGCGRFWHGPDLGDLVEAAVLSAWAPEPAKTTKA